MDLARATLVLIRVLRTLINSIAKNLHKLQICLRFYSFYKKLDIRAILFDFFYFPINAPALTKPRGLRAPDAEVVGGARCGAERRKDRGWEDQRTKGRRRMRRKDKRSGAMRRQPEPRKARRQVPYGILPCRPNGEKSHSSKKKRNGITSDYNFTAGIQPSLLRANP